MLYINNEILSGTEDALLTIFGTETVCGLAEVAITNGELDNDRFFVEDAIIPIIGAESMVRGPSFAPKTTPDMFDYVRAIAPPGLITFGEPKPNSKKKYSTHMDIILEQWGQGHGPHNPFLGVAIEGVHGENRALALEEMVSKIGSKAISMSRRKDDIHVETQ